jgi:hypothetical protein
VLRPRQRVIIGGFLGLIVLCFGWARVAEAAPEIDSFELPQTISASPFPVWSAVSGLEPGETYVYTLRVRQASSGSDFGSFWNGSVFTTSYSPAGVAAADGTLFIAAVVKPGSVTAPTALRLRIKQASAATPAPIDVSFMPSFGTVAVSGHAYRLGALATEGYVVAVDSGGAVVSSVGVGSGAVNPWSNDPGAYSLSLNAGTYRLRLLGSDRSTLSQSTDVVVGSEEVALDLDPPAPVMYSNEIFLSELLPDPSGDDTAGECIELENRGSVDQDLEGWRLTDAGGGEHEFSAGTLLPAGSFLCVPYGASHLSLNNGGDTISLLDPSGVAHSTVTYEEAGEGESWAWDAAALSWRWSLGPTPGAANFFPAPPETALLSVEQARVSEGAARVRGVVTAASGTLGSRIAYIQDETGGIQVYGLADLPLGAWVELRGKISSYHNERRFKFSSVIVLGQAALPEPLGPGRPPDEALEGRLVRYTGRIVRIRGSTVWVSAGGGEVKVVFRSSLGWKRPRLRTGDLIGVQGIVGQYSDLDEPEEGYRVLPRYTGDLEILEMYVKPKKVKAAKVLGVKTAEAAPGLALAQPERTLSYTSRPDRLLGFMLQLAGLLVLISGGLRALHRRDSSGD